VSEHSPFLLTQSDLATAGTVNFQLGVDPAENESRIIIESGYPLRNRIALIHPFARLEDSFFATEYIVDEGFGENRWSDRIASMGMLTKETAAGTVGFFAGLYSARFGSPTALRYEDYESGKMGFYGSYTSLTGGRSDRIILSLSDTYLYEKGEVKLAAAAFYRRFEIEDDYTGYLFYPDAGDFRRQQNKSITTYLSTVVDHKLAGLTDKLSLIAAGEWRGDWIDQEESQFDPVTGKPWLYNRSALAGVHHLGFAAGIKWVPVRWLVMEGGGRIDIFMMWLKNRLASDRHYNAFMWAPSPRVTLSLPVLSFMTLFGSYGRGFRSPEARSIMIEDLPSEDVELTVYQGGKPSITTSDSVEAGAAFTYRQYLRVSAAFFGTFISNETVFDHVSNTNILLNSTRRLGGELDVTVSPVPWLIIGGSLTGVEARFVESGSRIPGAPWLMAALNVTGRHRIGIEGSLSGFYIAPRPLAHGATGFSELMLNFMAAYRWKIFKISVQIENLLNRKACQGQYHYASWFDTSTERSMIPVIHCSAGDPFSFRLGLTIYV